MTRLEDRQTLMSWIELAMASGARQAPACAVAGIDPRTAQRWKAGNGLTLGDRRPDAVRPTPAHALSETERVRILDAVVRARHRNRALDGEVQHLWHHMLLRPKAGEIELRVPRHGKNPARAATMNVRFEQVALKPPAGKTALGPLRIWAVPAHETNAPPEVKAPLEWLLLTTEAVAGLSDAIERIQWYARRWGIEVFHRVLKSGCAIEDRQLGNAERLEACLAIDAVVAWRICHLTWLGRATPDMPCTAAFDDDQWKGIAVFLTRKPPPAQPPTAREMIRAIARLGGFLARKSDGEPGTQVMWRGLQRMDDIAVAFRGFRTAYKLPP